MKMAAASSRGSKGFFMGIGVRNCISMYVLDSIPLNFIPLLWIKSCILFITNQLKLVLFVGQFN
jgi:hypothetical protein